MRLPKLLSTGKFLFLSKCLELDLLRRDLFASLLCIKNFEKSCPVISILEDIGLLNCIFSFLTIHCASEETLGKVSEQILSICQDIIGRGK